MRIRTTLAGMAAATALVATAGAASAAVPHAGNQALGPAATFTVWATDVNVRDNPGNPGLCDGFPSTANCPAVAGKLQPGQPFEAICQNDGQTISGNPWWVYIQRGDTRGYIASYYVDNASNQLPGVPVCGS